jgi:hypothetical protein
LTRDEIATCTFRAVYQQSRRWPNKSGHDEPTVQSYFMGLWLGVREPIPQHRLMLHGIELRYPAEAHFLGFGEGLLL